MNQRHETNYKLFFKWLPPESRGSFSPVSFYECHVLCVSYTTHCVIHDSSDDSFPEVTHLLTSCSWTDQMGSLWPGDGGKRCHLHHHPRFLPGVWRRWRLQLGAVVKPWPRRGCQVERKSNICFCRGEGSGWNMGMLRPSFTSNVNGSVVEGGRVMGKEWKNFSVPCVFLSLDLNPHTSYYNWH